MLNCNLKLFSYQEVFRELVDLDVCGNMPSKIIFCGQEGIGKTTFALHLINYFFSKKEITKYNVNDNLIDIDSQSYNLVKNLSHPNFFCIKKNDDKKKIEIEQIRNMISFLNKSSFDNKKKIILIDGIEDLNLSSSNALLKSLEESSSQNIFLLTHNINKFVLDTIKSRCLIYRLNFNYYYVKSIISQYFDNDIYESMHEDFKSALISPNFLINHINLIKENNLDLSVNDVKSIIKFIINNKIYKKSTFVANNFQMYIEIYFTKLYSKTKDRKYYDFFLKSVTENNLITKYNLDLDSFFLKFENKYLNI